MHRRTQIRPRNKMRSRCFSFTSNDIASMRRCDVCRHRSCFVYAVFIRCVRAHLQARNLHVQQLEGADTLLRDVTSLTGFTRLQVSVRVRGFRRHDAVACRCAIV
jgi:hypothetical protein